MDLVKGCTALEPLECIGGWIVIFICFADDIVFIHL